MKLAEKKLLQILMDLFPGKSHSNDQATGTSHSALTPVAAPGQPKPVLLEKQTTDQTSHTETSSGESTFSHFCVMWDMRK